MEKSVLKALTKISCDDEKCIDSAELFGIDIYDFKESSSIEDGMVDAYNTPGIRLTAILFWHFWWYFNLEAIASCVPNDLILKTSNDDGNSLNAVFIFRFLESYIILCKRSSEMRWKKRYWLLSNASMAESSFLEGGASFSISLESYCLF